MNTSRIDTRRRILDTGKALITGKSFAGVGLTQILSTARVPKGSFYHYFESKEAFGEALLADYLGDYLGHMDTVLGTPGQGAAQSLMDYWDSWTDQSDERCECRCLVVKLSCEVADLSEP